MSEKGKRIEDLTKEEAMALWEKGESVELAPPPAGDRRMSLFTLRLDRDTFRGLEEAANEEGMPVSTMARNLIRDALERRIAIRSLEQEASAKTIYLLVADAVEARLKELGSQHR
ncbi:MAG: hypothetical protein V1748_11845 [Actinomycetota bacterium]